jgi:hypothetical protein
VRQENETYSTNYIKQIEIAVTRQHKIVNNSKDD